MDDHTLLEAVQTMFDSLKSDIQRIEKKIDYKSDKSDIQEIKSKTEVLESNINGVRVILESEIDPKIILLAEGQETIGDKLNDFIDRQSAVEKMDTRLSSVEAAVKLHAKEISALKKAQ